MSPDSILQDATHMLDEVYNLFYKPSESIPSADLQTYNARYLGYGCNCMYLCCHYRVLFFP
jgi:hypothetical protein